MIDYYTYICLCYKRTRRMGTTNPMAIVSDDIVAAEHEVYISDTTGVDDFQPLLRCLMS
ncbi:hypothetical protein HanPI659440_Chr08g0298731 [Helianthus annuus]|nr:hypothetical protein HanPI659440_Chr08g0298731 [Helianthus annuus]